MIKVTTKDTKDEIYDKCQEWLNELYDVLMVGVKLGLLGGVDGVAEDTTLENVIVAIGADVDETLHNIKDEFEYRAKVRINDLYRSMIDEIE